MSSCTCARVRVDDPPAVTFTTGEYVPYVPALEEWPGPYEVTPGAGAQTLATAGKLMTGDLTVGAIPSNYGLVTWDGSVLTVS